MEDHLIFVMVLMMFVWSIISVIIDIQAKLGQLLVANDETTHYGPKIEENKIKIIKDFLFLVTNHLNMV